MVIGGFALLRYGYTGYDVPHTVYSQFFFGHRHSFTRIINNY